MEQLTEQQKNQIAGEVYKMVRGLYYDGKLRDGEDSLLCDYPHVQDDDPVVYAERRRCFEQMATMFKNGYLK
jgi:hypothetical protein